MTDEVPEEPKPNRKPSSKAKAKPRPAVEEPAGEIEHPTPLQIPTPPPRVVEESKPVIVERVIDPNERGFDAETNSRYEEIKRGNTYITQLQQMTLAQLQEAAIESNIGREELAGLKKQDLVYRILNERVKQSGMMLGEGTLEVLPDGFGFLRSPDYNYLPCPDDIYISPSQIRRFGLRTGSVVAGQVRPPKENERYFALLRVEAINYQDPELFTKKPVFADLTPDHPTQRLNLSHDPGEM